MTKKGAVRKIGKVQYAQPDVLAKTCADNYPPRVYDSIHIEYMPGEARTDTVVTTKVDTVNKVKIVTNTITKYQRDTLLINKERQVENTARVDQLTKERDSLNTQNAVLSDDKKDMKKWLIILAITCAVLIIWKIANWLKWLPV